MALITEPGQLQAQAAQLADFCEQELNLAAAYLPQEYFYHSLSLCVIDAVYSIGVRYAGVRNVVHRYCVHFGLQEFRNSREVVPPQDAQEPLSAFVQKIDTIGVERFAKEIFRNRQRTSSRNGILKSQAVLRFASTLNAHGVCFLQDVQSRATDSKLEAALRLIPGQTSGISISYFFMLSGNEHLVKPDRWIGRFLARRLGVEPSPAEAQSLVVAACAILLAQYAHLTPRLLDYTIWSYERGRGGDFSSFPASLGI